MILKYAIPQHKYFLKIKNHHIFTFTTKKFDKSREFGIAPIAVMAALSVRIQTSLL
jgi:hypothetical protein